MAEEKRIPVETHWLQRGGFDPDAIGVVHGDEPPPDVDRPEPMRFADEHGLYVCHWGNPRFVSIEFDQIRTENRSGEVTAEVTVSSTVPGLTGLLHQARANLSSTQARSTLAKHLTTRRKEPGVDWSELLENAIVATLQAYRAGEPAILLRDAPRPIDAGFLLPPILLGRLPVILFGRGGDGKSLLALAAAASIASGRTDILGIKPTATPVVGYFDWEMDAWEHRERLLRITGEPMPGVVYVRCRGALWEEADRLRRIIRDHGIGYAFLDSVGLACGGVPIETSEAPQRFFEALRRLDIGSALLAHKVKDQESDEYPFGSIFWHNNARRTWLVKKEQDEGEGKFVIGLFNKKANTGPISPPIAFGVDYGDRVTFHRRDAVDVEEFASKVPVSLRMRQALRSGPRLLSDLADDLGVNQQAIRSAANRRPQMFVLAGRGKDATVALAYRG